PVDPKSAEDIASYSLGTHTYKYYSVYGSPPVTMETAKIKGVKLSDEGLRVRIGTDDLKKNHGHNLTIEGVRSKDSCYSLVHPTAYYTLHNIPAGDALPVSQLSTNDSSVPVVKKAAAPKPAAKTTAAAATPAKKAAAKPAVAKAPTFNEVKGILTKNTCLACHNTDKKLVGPSFKEIAKRNYSDEKIAELIRNPQPQNWPDYPTEMPPMPHVPKADVAKIAA